METKNENYYEQVGKFVVGMIVMTAVFYTVTVIVPKATLAVRGAIAFAKEHKNETKKEIE